MSTTTPYLGLTLYDATTDQVVTFATFRTVWGGTAVTSNFYKIDTSASSFNSRITALETTRGAISVPATFISANFYQATGIPNITAYNTGMTIVLSLDTTSSGTVTLDINSLGTKSAMKVDSTGTAINLTGSDLVDGRQYLFVYDGTRWLWVSANSADQIQIVGTSGNVVTVGSTNNLLGTTTQAGLVADTIHAATGKTTPVDADELGLADSAASFILKRLTIANLKALILAYILPNNYITSNGLVLSYNSAASISVSSGSCKAESGVLYSVSGTITKSSLTMTTNTWYHVYLISSSDAEVVTTAPTSPYLGFARSKTGDTSARYLGSIRAIGSNTAANFIMSGNQVSYRENSVASPFRVLNGGSATTETSIDVSAVVPVSSRIATLRIFNGATTAGIVYTGVSDDSTVPPSSGLTVTGNNSTTVTPHPVNSSQALTYAYSVTPTGAPAVCYMDCYGYLLER